MVADVMGLGIMFALGAVGFIVMYARSNSFVYQVMGRYGFMLLMLLSIFQESIDFGYATTPLSAGLAYWVIIPLFLMSLLFDSAFLILVILPKRRKGLGWKEILYGESD